MRDYIRIGKQNYRLDGIKISDVFSEGGREVLLSQKEDSAYLDPEKPHILFWNARDFIDFFVIVGCFALSIYFFYKSWDVRRVEKYEFDELLKEKNFEADEVYDFFGDTDIAFDDTNRLLMIRTKENEPGLNYLIPYDDIIDYDGVFQSQTIEKGGDSNFIMAHGEYLSVGHMVHNDKTYERKVLEAGFWITYRGEDGQKKKVYYNLKQRMNDYNTIARNYNTLEDRLGKVLFS